MISDIFRNQLQELGISPSDYLQQAQTQAVKYGYNPEDVEFSNDTKHKLQYKGVRFGAVSFKDFIIYRHLAKQGVITSKVAKNHRIAYLKRAIAQKGNWMSNRESAACLSINILW
jgi:hypothetical protein